jgi:hypothetical protein
MTKKKWAITLTLGYIVTFLFSNGPGILLINRAGLVLGFPPLYLWAVFWGAVQVSILIAAYFLVWSVGETSASGSTELAEVSVEPKEGES